MELEVNEKLSKELRDKVREDVKDLDFNDRIKEYAAASILEELESEAIELIKSVCVEDKCSRADLLETSVLVVTYLKDKKVKSEQKPCTKLLSEMIESGIFLEEAVTNNLYKRVEDIKNSLIESVL